jgi:hypothetical protein
MDYYCWVGLFGSCRKFQLLPFLRSPTSQQAGRTSGRAGLLMLGRFYGGLPSHHPRFGNFSPPKMRRPIEPDASFTGDRKLTARLW